MVLIFESTVPSFEPTVPNFEIFCAISIHSARGFEIVKLSFEVDTVLLALQLAVL